MLPKLQDKEAWRKLYQKMQEEGRINQPIVALRQVGDSVEVMAQAGSYDEMLNMIGFTSERIYILAVKTHISDITQGLNLPSSYSKIEIANRD